MKSQFNNGRPYHGSSQVEKGKLTGATDTDYFYFFCPQCPDRQILQILEYGVHTPPRDNEYNEIISGKKSKYGFTLVFKLYCERCNTTDFVKITNTGWQGGSYDAIPFLRADK
jgi:hypothetical protein